LSAAAASGHSRRTSSAAVYAGTVSATHRARTCGARGGRGWGLETARRFLGGTAHHPKLCMDRRIHGESNGMLRIAQLQKNVSG